MSPFLSNDLERMPHPLATFRRAPNVPFSLATGSALIWAFGYDELPVLQAISQSYLISWHC